MSNIPMDFSSKVTYLIYKWGGSNILLLSNIGFLSIKCKDFLAIGNNKLYYCSYIYSSEGIALHKTTPQMICSALLGILSDGGEL